jgi:hypothetical protein
LPIPPLPHPQTPLAVNLAINLTNNATVDLGCPPSASVPASPLDQWGTAMGGGGSGGRQQGKILMGKENAEMVIC